ncbi:MAG: hypothetical protein M3Y87_13910 [Myxococcota bacterium]|nr:hypothetical protein [Myxococcota bacterium]
MSELSVPALWLRRYRDPLPVRSRGSFHVVSVVRATATPGARSIVILGSKSANVDGVRTALDRIASAHERIEHPNLPRVIERGEDDGTPFLELACDAVVDGTELLRLLADSGQKLTFAQGDAIFTRMRETLQAAHLVTDPRTGGPYCLGRVSYGNILIGASGRLSFVGLGHNFPVEKEDGRLEGTGSVWQAPELLGGEPATPLGDYVAIVMIVRSLFAFCELGEVARRFFAVAASRDNLEAFELSRWFDTQLVAQRPDARPSIDEALAKMRRLREILGITVDMPGFEARAAALIAEAAGEPRDPIDGEVVTVASDGGWVAVGGERRKLGRANQHVLRALLLAHRHQPGREMDVWQLLEAGWPGEEPLPEAGANRVYVAIGRLRSLGLRQVIERSGSGYRIAPTAALRVAGVWS